MTPELEQLVRDAISLTDAEPPVLMQDETPTLVSGALDDPEGFYLIGLIGGKEVGKSALVNALVGRPITAETFYGAGTETAVAYAHASQVAPLRELLAREIPGRFSIVTHDVPQLRGQVLLDLPDIDSVHSAHLELTRRMLRHMLFPVWVQSVEKYADIQFQQLLAKVAAGNAPENFVFCLNKVDQLVAREGANAVEELRDDYAERLWRVVASAEPPRVWMVSATRPDTLELPALRKALSRDKSEREVTRSRTLASRQQALSVLSWVDSLDVRARVQRLARLEQDADEIVRDRMALPLVDRAVPALIDDPAHRLSILDACQWRRASRWPVVNLIHVLLSPLLLVIRRNVQAAPAANSATAGALDLARDPERLAAVIKSTFAHLHHAHPSLSSLYHHRRLWEDAPADLAAQSLQRKVADTLQHQRTTILARVANRTGWFYRLPRAVLTLGALVWFPFVQPFLEAYLASDNAGPRVPVDLTLLLVRVLGVTSLLQNAAFLILYFLALWLLLRWDTLRLVDRRLLKWRTAANLDPSLNPAAAVLEWTADLTAPIRSTRQSLDALLSRAELIRRSLTSPAAAA
jgi:hypothetical protein